MTKTEANNADVGAILDHVERLNLMPVEELIALFRENKEDSFCTIPHPRGTGTLFCGKEAYGRFWSLAKRYLSERAIENCTRFFRKLCRSAETRVLQEIS
jgi:hypothetical protein